MASVEKESHGFTPVEQDVIFRDTVFPPVKHLHTSVWMVVFECVLFVIRSLRRLLGTVNGRGELTVVQSSIGVGVGGGVPI